MTKHYGHHNHYNHLHVPDHWEHYWSKYPNGYTLLEALISWTSQVNDMINSYNHMSDDMVALDRNFKALDKELRASWAGYKDHTEKNYSDFRDEILTIVNNWIAMIEPTIQDTVVNSLSNWLADGTLADIINNDVFSMKANTEDVIQLGANVRHFGAKGDGLTDDTQAFKDAIDTGNEVVVPKGNYLISERLFLKNSIRGIGTPKIIFNGDGHESTRIFTVVGYQGNGLHIEGFYFDGGYDGVGTDGEQSHAISLYSSSNVFIHDNFIDSPYGDNVYVGGDQKGNSEPKYSENIHIFRNVFLNPRRCNVAIVSAKKIWVRDNDFRSHNGYVAMIDIEPNNDSQLLIEDIVIEGNHFKGEGYFVNWVNPVAGVSKRLTVRNNVGESHYFFRVSGGDAANGIFEEVLIEGNTFYGSIGDARMFTISPYVRNLIIRNNLDMATGNAGWSIRNIPHTIVQDNIVDAPRAVGMSFTDCDHLNIDGNTFKKVSSSNGSLFVSSDTGAPVTGTRIVNNTFLGADYAIQLGSVLKEALINNNYFQFKRRGINVSAYGSDIHIGMNNTFKGNGIPVVGYDRLEKITNPEVRVAGRGVYFSFSKPTTGAWSRGDIIFNVNPATGGFVGWVCTSTGTFGTDTEPAIREFGQIQTT